MATKKTRAKQPAPPLKRDGYLLTVHLGDHVFHTLMLKANENRATIHEFVSALLGSAADGFARPGAWENEHAEALIRPFVEARRGSS